LYQPEPPDETNAGPHDKTASSDKMKRLMIEPEDLIRYGLIPEFVGRLPVLGTLN